MTPQAARIARAEARMARRWRAVLRAAYANHAEYQRAVDRYQRAVRVWQLRRNQAGIVQ